MYQLTIGGGGVNRVAWCCAVLMFVLALGNMPAHAQETKAAASKIDEKAMATLMRMAEFLAKAKQFSVTADIGYDTMQDLSLIHI